VNLCDGNLNNDTCWELRDGEGHRRSLGLVYRQEDIRGDVIEVLEIAHQTPRPADVAKCTNDCLFPRYEWKRLRGDRENGHLRSPIRE
jgi:hypothetical protein